MNARLKLGHSDRGMAAAALLCTFRSQLACRNRLKVTVPPHRLSGMSPESRSGDAKEAWVRCEAAFATQLSDKRKHSLRLPSC